MHDHSTIESHKERLLRALTLVAVLTAVFLVVITIKVCTDIHYAGSGITPANTITVTGEGKVDKAPDTARFSFTVQDDEKDVATAQSTVSDKVTKVKNDLIAAGVSSDDISTDSYSSYPQYDYATHPCLPGLACPNNSTPVLKGYEVSQDVDVTVKNLAIVQNVVGILGNDAVTDIDGPNFGFADDTEVTDAARDLAIANAKIEAQKLASSLGVHLVRIVSFTDQNSGNAPVPMYAKAVDMASPAAATPALPTGTQDVDDTVSVTYQIR